MERLFTEDEANALLPQLRELLPRLQEAHAAVQERARSAGRRAASNGSAAAAASAVDGDFAALLQELEALGVVVRDPESGLVDFAAERSGEPIYLCWRLGEDRVGHWHPRDAGFAGRQPL